MRKLFASLLALAALPLTACAGGTGSDTAGTGGGTAGAVYYLNFKPEANDQWRALAAAYTAETGVPVTVVTAASGQYETQLMAEMAKSNPPTLFHVNGPVGLMNWEDYCYDLTGTAIAGEAVSRDYTLEEDGDIKAVAMAVESYGIIVNKTLLARAGYSVEEIGSFGDLKRIAEDITARREELGFAAFTSAGMDGSSSWRFHTHLANLPLYYEYRARGVDAAEEIEGAYLDNYRAVWDLYIQNAVCAPAALAGKTVDDSRNEFLAGEAVFYQNGSWEYGNLVGEGRLSDGDLAMIPIYIGAEGEANQGLCTGTENYWCVNDAAGEEDIRATLDFIHWCVTSEAGTDAMANDMGFVIPFQSAAESPNLFVRQDAAYTAAGRTPVRWDFSTMPSQTWKDNLGSALTAYAAGTGDWAAVESAFVDGWAGEWELLD